jgi:hypothetical protein
MFGIDSVQFWTTEFKEYCVCVFHVAVGSWYYIVSSGRMLSESWIGKDVDGSDRDVLNLQF